MPSVDRSSAVGFGLCSVAPIRAFAGALALSVLLGAPARAADPGALIEHVKKIVAFDGAADDSFGISVSVSGDVAVVGAHADDDAGGESGSAYVFGRNVGGANNWGLLKKLVAPDAAMSDLFGLSVSVSGDVAVVGAYEDDDAGTASGSAYVFARDAGGADNWGFVKKLVAPDAAMGDLFGKSVSVSGGVAAIGAHLDQDAGGGTGAAYVFHRDQGGADNWGFVKKLVAPDAAPDSLFGGAVSIDGDVAVVGAPLDDSVAADSGSAYVFGRNVGGTDNWGFVKKLLAPDGAAGDFFGGSVSVNGDAAVVGAFTDDDAGFNSGSAYVFGRDVGGTDNWGFVKKLVAPDGAGADLFGMSIATDGVAAVVGAHSDDDAGSDSGSAYVFARDAGGVDNWGFVRKLLAPDGAAEDTFGYAVTADGDTAVVGAFNDDDAGSKSGSAHVFGGLKFVDLALADCDGSGGLDAVEIAKGGAADCNDNGRHDSCDIADGASLDANMNGVPDECDLVCLGDLNGDNAVDTADLGLLLQAFGSICVP